MASNGYNFGLLEEFYVDRIQIDSNGGGSCFRFRLVGNIERQYKLETGSDE